MRVLEFVRNVAFVAMLGVVQTTVHAAELLMIDSDDCPYCRQFLAEVGPAYPNTEEGKTAPLKILQLGDPLPQQYQHIEPAFVTPTFILIDNNKEIDRLEGYSSEYFWFLLGEMLEKLKQ